MNWNQLKSIIDKMTSEQRKQDIYYKSDEYSISGVVMKVKKASFDYLWDGEDDPSTLLSRSQAKNNGMDTEEIDGLTIEIPKGGYFIDL